MKRGYFGIGIYHTKTKENVGTLWRSAMNFGAAFIFTIGRRYKKQCSDTLKTYRHIPLFHYKDFSVFRNNIPFSCPVVGIEQTATSKDIKDFKHLNNCIYLLGAEDGGLPKEILNKCQEVVHISTPMCLNVATAGSIIMFDRNNKKNI